MFHDRDVIERFSIRHPNGGPWKAGVLLRTRRPGGRRIVVQAGGLQVFDTGDQFDQANAVAVLNEWLTRQVRELLRPEAAVA